MFVSGVVATASLVGILVALFGAVLSLRTWQAYAVLVGTLGALALLIWGGN